MTTDAFIGEIKQQVSTGNLVVAVNISVGIITLDKETYDAQRVSVRSWNDDEQFLSIELLDGDISVIEPTRLDAITPQKFAPFFYAPYIPMQMPDRVLNKSTTPFKTKYQLNSL